MRIALIHNLQAGGARRAMMEHHRHLHGELLEFCLQTSVPVSDSAYVVPLQRTAELLPAALRPLPRHLDLVLLAIAWRRLASAVNRAGFDVVLAHPCQYLQAPPALLWMRAPTVYFCHEPRRVDYEAAAASQVNPRTRTLYAGLHRAERRLDRAAVASAMQLLTNSRFTAGRIAHAYDRRAEPVPLGVAHLFLKPLEERPTSHLLSVGSLIPSKGHDHAIRAAALAARRRPLVVVAPRAAPGEAARLQAIAHASGVELDIRIGVSDEELRELYCGSLVTLYLAREEPFGLVSLESQACGTPVIVADEGGLPETMIEGETGWAVPREDLGSVARAIDALEDPALRIGASARAREHGMSQTWGRSAKRVECVLEQTASR